ncbi:MAG TPA: TolC family protein, partial [Polyangiales bacterium]|nr:TolC family protein [Polyangiales bacterium]
MGKVTLSLEKRLQDLMKGNGLTAEQVAAKAVSVSPQVEAKRRSVQAADASVDQSQLAFLPALTLSARYTRLSRLNYPASSFALVGTATPNADGTVDPDSLRAFSTTSLAPQILNQYAFQASLSVPISDYLLRMSYAVDASKRTRAAAQIDEQATKLAVARDARVEYYNWIYAQGAAYIGEQRLVQAQGQLTDAQNSWTAGVMSKADVLLAESNAKAAELFAEQTRNGVIIATERLRTRMHDAQAVNYEVGENILADLKPSAEDFEKAYSEALSKRLELKILTEQEGSLSEQVNAVEAARYPRLDATANALLANPNQRYFPATDSFKPTWDVGVVLSWTPTTWFATSAAAKAVEARVSELAAQRQNFRDGLR